MALRGPRLFKFDRGRDDRSRPLDPDLFGGRRHRVNLFNQSHRKDKTTMANEDNNCPRENCKRPESTHRWAAGKKLSICGNGHSWDPEQIRAERAKAQDANKREYQAPKFDEFLLFKPSDRIRFPEFPAFPYVDPVIAEENDG